MSETKRDRATLMLKREEIAIYCHNLGNTYYSLQEIAGKFDTTPSTVQKALTQFGIERVPKKHLSPLQDRNESIVKEYYDNKTLQEIADKHGITRQRVYQILVNCRAEKREKQSFKPTIDKIKFTGLKKYLLANKISLRDLYDKIKVDYSLNYFYSKLVGTAPLDMDTINKILEVTNLTYENCFNY